SRDGDKVVDERDFTPQLRGKPTRAAAVDAQADHRVAALVAAAARSAGLDQDAAELGAVDHEVVGPFQRRLAHAEGAQRARRRDAGDQRQGGKLASGPADAAAEREGEPRAGRAVPAPPAPAAARGLLLRSQQYRIVFL